MRISAADLSAYRAALRAIASDAASSVTDALRYAVGPRTTVSEARVAAIGAIMDSVGIHGDAAQALAAQMFDEVCAAEGIDATAELFDGVIDPGRVESAVYHAAREVVQGRRGLFVEECGQLADYYAMRSAYESTVRNCAANNMRYARIPTGPETCDWCLMLASRGFVYYTEQDAMAGNHRACDCICLPGRGGDSFNDPTQVEGYDPDEYYQLWRQSGFMPPLNNPQRMDGSYERMVYNHDGTSQRRRAAREAGALRNLTSQQAEAIYARLNGAASKSEDALHEEYMDIIGGFIKAGDTLTDADWEDVGNHYAWLLSEIKRKG